MKCTALALAFVSGVTVMSAQAPSPAPSAPAFEVASVKQNVSGETRTYYSNPPGVRWTNVTLRMLVVRAYGIEPTIERMTLLGGPERILSMRFDITAKEPEGTPPGQTMAMLRTLLADRFKLRIRNETRQMPIYAVTVSREGKLGPNLRPSSHDCIAFAAAGGRRDDVNAPRGADDRPLCFVSDSLAGGAITIQRASPLSQLLNRAQGFVDRPLVDATGLTGSYEWQLTFNMRGQLGDSTVPSIYTAFSKQLGLKLEPRNGPVDVFVIDSVGMPTPD